MQLTSFTDYSFKVLIYLSIHPNKFSTISEIAEFYQISRNHLVKVVNNLSQKGYINSSRGKGGGLALATDPEKINVGSVVRDTEANLVILDLPVASDVELSGPGSNHVSSRFALNLIVELAQSRFMNILDVYYLSDIVDKSNTDTLNLILSPKMKSTLDKLEVDVN